jgi:hypothetical protein
MFFKCEEIEINGMERLNRRGPSGSPSSEVASMSLGPQPRSIQSFTNTAAALAYTNQARILLEVL